jgi:hypothetical protein
MDYGASLDPPSIPNLGYQSPALTVTPTITPPLQATTTITSPLQATTPPIQTVTSPGKEEIPNKKCTEAPWPTIIIAIVGVGLVIYTGVAPDIEPNLRVFGLVLMLLWTILWAILLWVLWHECHQVVAWWLLILPIAVMLIFFILIIILKFGINS